MNITRRPRLPVIYLDLALECFSDLEIEMDALRHAGVISIKDPAPGGNPLLYPVRAGLRRMEGAEDYHINVKIKGHVEGRVRTRINFQATHRDAFPKAVHVALTESDELYLRLDDYVVDHNRGFGRWIKRLRLVPLALLESLANHNLQNFLIENRKGWPIIKSPAEEERERAQVQEGAPAKMDLKPC